MNRITHHARRFAPSVLSTTLALALALAGAGCGADVTKDDSDDADAAATVDDGGSIGGGGDSVGVADGAPGDSASGGGTDGGGTDGGGSGGDGGGTGDGGEPDDVVKDTGLGSNDPWWACPPIKGTGNEHGKACTDKSECMYGQCVKGGFLTGYDDAISYCTKNNACTGGGSFTTAPCDYDDDKALGGVTYKSVFEKSNSSGNDKRTSAEPFKLCGRTCQADSECASWNAQMPHCIKSSTKYVSIGTQGICGKDPTR